MSQNKAPILVPIMLHTVKIKKGRFILRHPPIFLKPCFPGKHSGTIGIYLVETCSLPLEIGSPKVQLNTLVVFDMIALPLGQPRSVGFPHSSICWECP